MSDKTKHPEGASGTGIPAGTAKAGTDNRPDIGDTKSGRKLRDDAAARPTDELAPEAKGGAGGGRRWAGDS